MKKSVFVVLFLLSSSFAFAEGQFDFSGYLKNEIGIRLQDFNGDLQKFKNIAEVAGEYTVKEDVVLFAKVKYWYDLMYDFRSQYDKGQDAMGHIQRTDWLRDCYLDYTNGAWFLRLGKQQVAWGQADGITVLDRVNPVDLSEYWLQDFVDMRIPLWMANVNYAPKLNSNLQILIIPDFEQSTSAPIGSPFTTYAYTRYDNWKESMKRIGGSVDENIYFPAKKFENSTFGLQWSDRIGDLAYTLNFLDGYYYSARNTTIGLGGVRFKVDRAFKRWQMYGSSFNKTFTNPGFMQGITLRGDLALYKHEPTYIGDPVTASAKEIKRWDNVFWLIGADRYVATNWLLSFQFAQYILDEAKAKDNTRPVQQQYPLNPFTYGPADQVENIFSLKVSTDFMNERLKPEVLWSFTDDNQGRISPKVTYEVKDNLWLTCGIHYFYGDLLDSNGQYREQGQFYTQLKYTF